jgi:hypothetical protein
LKSRRTEEFKANYRNLPLHVRRQALAAYRLFLQNPFHPSLQFKRVSKSEPLYSVRVSLHYRALGLREEDNLIIWFWIGDHGEYERLIHQF